MELLHTAHVPSGDGKFPTVLALHGWGASAHDLLGLSTVLHRGKALVICPEGPLTVPIGQGITGHGWFPLADGGQVAIDDVHRATDLVARFLDEMVERYPVDPRKTIILGFSQGGVISYDLALRDPERFAGLVALSSWLPDALSDGLSSSGFVDLPTYVVHGTEDPLLPVERGRHSRDKLLELGVPTTYREYEMQHEIKPEALKDLVQWLEEKVFQPILLT